MTKPESNQYQKSSFVDGIKDFFGVERRRSAPMVEAEEGKIGSEEELVGRERRYIANIDIISLESFKPLIDSFNKKNDLGEKLTSTEIAFVWGWFHSISKNEKDFVNLSSEISKIRLKRSLMEDANGVDDLYKSKAARTLMQTMGVLNEEEGEWERRWNYIERYGDSETAAEIVMQFSNLRSELVSEKSADKCWNFLERYMDKDVASLAVHSTYFNSDENSRMYYRSRLKYRMLSNNRDRENSFLYKNRLRMNELIIRTSSGGDSEGARWLFRNGLDFWNCRMSVDDGLNWVKVEKLFDRDWATDLLTNIISNEAFYNGDKLAEAFKLMEGMDIERMVREGLRVNKLLENLGPEDRKILLEMFESSGGIRALKVLEEGFGGGMYKNIDDQNKAREVVKKIKERL